MKICPLILSISLILPVSIFAHITGTYKVSGFDPDTNGKYTGTLHITKNDSIYNLIWYFKDSTDYGTGVRKHDSLAVVFNEDNSNSYGTSLYEIEEDTLKGPWARYGASSKGYETAKKIHH